MRQILVVREFDDFSRILSASGFSVINCPAITTAALEDLSDLAAKLKNIEIYDGIFLTSAAAAKVLCEKLSELKIKPSCKIYVLGKRSYDLLNSANFKTIYFADANTASEMLEKIAPDDLKGKRFLFVRGEKSLRVVPDFLGGIAEIDETIVYRTKKNKIAPEKLSKLGDLAEKHLIECAVFFSPSGAESFLEQCGTGILHQTKIAAIGRTTADFFERRNLKVAFVSSKANAKNFAADLVKYLKETLTTDFHR